MEEATASLAAAKEISEDAAVVVVYHKLMTAGNERTKKTKPEGFSWG